MRQLITLGATLAMLLAAGDAGAGASAHLVYVRGPGAEKCPGESAIHAAVSVRFGYGACQVL